MGAVDHSGLEKFPIGDIGVCALKFDDFSDLSHFLLNEWRVDISFSVDQSEDVDSVFPAVLLCEPTWRFWQEDESEEEEDGWEHLKAPWDSEC